MKHILWIGLFIISAAFIKNVFSKKIILSLGDVAPLFSVKDQDGQIHNLLDYKGRKVIVYFFPMADTPGWIKEACGFRNIYEEFKKNNFTVFGVSYNKQKSLRNFKDKYNLPFNFLSDRDRIISKSYGADGLVAAKRMTFVIDEFGNIEKIYRKVNINTHAETILEDILK